VAKQLDYLKNPSVHIDGHDFSGYVKSASVNRQKDELDTTASGDGAHSQIPGFSKDSFTFNFYQDKDMTILDAVLSNIYDAETAVVVEVTKSGSTISESNPSWTGNAKLYNYSPFQGDVGTVVMAPATFQCDGPIVRAGT
jgi:hypothetical protein